MGTASSSLMMEHPDMPVMILNDDEESDHASKKQEL